MLNSVIITIFAAAARRAIRREKPFIIAVTGSVGKSSAKETIAAALGAREAGSSVRASLKNYNNEYGVPFTILNVQTPGRDPLKWLLVLWRTLWLGWGFGRIGATTLILEMGADHKGDLAWLVGIAPPSISVITAVAPAHTEFFGTVDDVANEKATLIRALPADGLGVLNNDDSRVTAMRKECRTECAYFGTSEGSDVRIVDAQTLTETNELGHIFPVGLVVSFAVLGKEYALELRGTVGRPQAYAAAAALAVATKLDIPAAKALERLERDYHGIPGRTRIIKGIKGTYLIDDSYNAASATAVISALRDLAGIPVGEGQRRIAAFGDMRELGEYSDEAHRSVGHEAAALGIDELVTCGTLARAIAAAAQEAGMSAERIHSFDTSAEGGLFLQGLIRQGDLILVKGSQGSRMEKVVKELMAEPLQAPFLLVRMTKDWIHRP
ncbi:UDP-N-acetylmuramoyl-tripeptide--D-alanyl-D-alanine ligase [candidate division WWE3 bacterium]|uniref:UDP-N-acetylmuramoyl-tripeptide--D-alanyl-D-alanine ligase n=1 Tax=candidate division WWE3 bacterium TaxID=2053526 RepID=A0A928TPZ1_UNCKA|nr:UDP-N-acetylmuramoyl-tripeptide--D-alanyl-D-alanine ligase [candidate division WWE3 bacterium]